MRDILEIINVFGIIGTGIISVATLFTTRSLQRKQQKATIMANKRSERIDLMREFSAGVISCGKCIFYDVDNVDTKVNLIGYTDKLNSLLQYEYIHDVEIIDCANAIVEVCLSKKVDKGLLKRYLQEFWKICDVYVGVEYERLKLESMGEINRSGNVNSETKMFEDIYQILVKQQNEIFLSKKKATNRK